MKKIYLLLAIFFLFFLLSAAGCSHSQLRIPSLPLRGADLYPQEQSKDGLIVAADEYFDEDKSRQTFGVNFAEKNVLIVEIIVSNRSDNIYMVQSNEVLLLKGDQIIYPLLALEVSSDEQVNEYLNMVELRDIVVNPGETSHGFLYFRLPEKHPEEDGDDYFSSQWPVEGYKLRVGATQIEGNSRLIYTIYLRNL
jgi:hypothetical protein